MISSRLQRLLIIIISLILFLSAISLILVNIKSNIASKVKYKWVMRFMQKSGFWRCIIRKLIFSLKWRQIIVNKIHRANTRSFKPKPLSKEIRKEIYNNYFLDDIKKLESILGREMNWQE